MFCMQNHIWELGPIETSHSGANLTVLHSQRQRWGLGHIDTCNFAPKSLFWKCKITDEGWDPQRLVILVLITLFACTKRQVMSGIHRDLLFGSKRRCFASNNHRWGLGPIETSNSDVNHAVLHAQNDRWSLEPIETCNSGPKVAVMHAQIDRWSLGPTENCNFGAKYYVLFAQVHTWDLGPSGTTNSGHKDAVLHAQIHRRGLGPIEICKSGAKQAVLFAQSTDEVRDP